MWKLMFTQKTFIWMFIGAFSIIVPNQKSKPKTETKKNRYLSTDECIIKNKHTEKYRSVIKVNKIMSEDCILYDSIICQNPMNFKT